MMWPLLDRVGACKRFQILAESRPVLSRARPSGRLQVTDKIETVSHLSPLSERIPERNEFTDDEI